MTRSCILCTGFLVTSMACAPRDAQRSDSSPSSLGANKAPVNAPRLNVATAIDSLVADTLWMRLTAFETRAVTHSKLGEPQRVVINAFPTERSLQQRPSFHADIQVGDSAIAWTYADGTVFTFRVRKGQEMLVEVRAKPVFPPIADLGKRYSRLAFDDTDPIQPPADSSGSATATPSSTAIFAWRTTTSRSNSLT